MCVWARFSMVEKTLWKTATVSALLLDGSWERVSGARIEAVVSRDRQYGLLGDVNQGSAYRGYLGTTVEGISAADGRFVIEGLERGTCELVVDRSEYSIRPQRLEDGQEL